MSTRSKQGVSLADVAKLAGVSAQTVSRVANGSDAVRPKTRERVLSAMEQLGYRPSFAARSLRKGSYHSIGLVMSGNITSTGRRFQLEQAAAAATEHGYALTLLQLPDPDATFEEAARRMDSMPVDGVIMSLRSIPSDFTTFEPHGSLPTALICVRPHHSCPAVDNDHGHCSSTIVGHLADKGHREIRFVGGRRESLPNANLLAGWREAMEARGLPVAEPRHGDWTADSGYEIGARLAADASCTAVFAANDAMAVGVIFALRDAGRRVPEDVSVIGVDDSVKDVVPHLDLSTFRFDNKRVGTLAFELATTARTYDEVPHILVPGTLVERSTVAEVRR